MIRREFIATVDEKDTSRISSLIMKVSVEMNQRKMARRGKLRISDI